MLATALLALLAAALHLFREKPDGPAGKESRWLPWGAGLAVLAATMLAGQVDPQVPKGVQSAGFGILIALLASGLLAWGKGAAGAAMGAAAVAIAAVGALPGHKPDDLLFGALIGLSLGAWAVGGLSGSILAASGIAGVSLSVLATRTTEGAPFPLGAAILALGSLVWLGASALPKQTAKELVLVAAVGIGSEILVRTAFPAALVGLGFGGAVFGWLTIQLLPAGNEEAWKRLLAAGLWLALGGFAFGVGRGLGVALSAGTGLAVVAALGSPSALTAMALPIFLGFFRAFREVDTTSLRFLDFGYNHLLLGLILAMLLPSLVSGLQEKLRSPAGAALWPVAVFVAVLSASLVLGSAGITGMVVGLAAFCFVSPALPNSISIAGLMGGAAVLAPSWLGELRDVAREEKVRILVFAALGVALLLTAIVLTRRPAAAGTESANHE